MKAPKWDLSPTRTLREGNWTYREYVKIHKDLVFLKELCFVWPGLLNDYRVKYVVDNARKAENSYRISFTLVYYNEVLHGVTKVRLIDEHYHEPEDIPSSEAIVPPQDWELLQLTNTKISYTKGVVNRALTLEGDNRTFWRPTEKWARNKDALRESRGENVSNWADWTQEVGSAQVYERFWAWHREGRIRDYIVPIYWRVAR